MSTNELRRQAGKRIKELSPERLQVAVDFLAYLQERESNEATDELLRIPGLMDAFRQTTKPRSKRSKMKSVPWRKVRSDV